MLAEETRKVGEAGAVGQRSLFVRIPTTWARAVGIEKGQSVTLLYGPGQILVVAPQGAEPEGRRALGRDDL
jgi:antitoxin component of MazEF toxin-antitoxin module